MRTGPPNGISRLKRICWKNAAPASRSPTPWTARSRCIGSRNGLSLLHFFQRLRQIGLQVGRVFEADVESHDAVAISGAAGARAEVISDGEACHAGPTVADFEEGKIVYKSVDLPLGKALFENDGEYAGRSGEIAFEEFVARAGRQRRMKHEFDFRSSREPLCQSKRGFFDRGKAHRESFQPAESERAIVWRSGAAKQLMRKPDFLIRRVVAHGDRPEKKVAVATNVFRQGLHRHVNAVSE